MNISGKKYILRKGYFNMPLTIYERYNVTENQTALVTGKLTFNVLNHKRKVKPNQWVQNPADEYSVTVENAVVVKGDENLKNVLEERMYGDNNSLSLKNTGNFAPMIFGSDNSSKPADELIPDGKQLENGTEVLIHVSTFKGNGNIGMSFDGIKLHEPLNLAPIVDVQSGIQASAFDF